MDLRHTICPTCDDYKKPHPSNIIEVFIELFHIIAKGFNTTIHTINNEILTTQNKVTNKYKKLKYLISKRIPTFLLMKFETFKQRFTFSSDDRKSSSRSRNDDHYSSYEWFNWNINKKRKTKNIKKDNQFNKYGTIPWINYDSVDTNRYDDKSWDSNNYQNHKQSHQQRRKRKDEKYDNKVTKPYHNAHRFIHQVQKLFFDCVDSYNFYIEHSQQFIQDSLSNLIDSI